MPSFSTPCGAAGLRAGLHAEVAGGFGTDPMLNIHYQSELIKVISLHLPIIGSFSSVIPLI